MDYEGMTSFALLDRAKELFARLSHLWLEAGDSGEDKGGDWVQKTLGWTVQIVIRSRKPAPKEVLIVWAEQWAKEGMTVDWPAAPATAGIHRLLPRRWVVERTFAWISHKRRMSKEHVMLLRRARRSSM